MIRAVVDTNILVSGLIRRSPAAPPALVLDAWRAGLFELAVSSHLLIEVERTLEAPYFRRRMTSQQAARFVELLTLEARQIEITKTVKGVASHPEDDLVLATAVSADAAYLVTGDHDLLRLGSYQSLAIVGARQFLATLALEPFGPSGS